MPLQTGDKAPIFSLYNSEKNKISIEEYNSNKNVLLLFFPLAFTGTCTVELCSVRDGINKYLNESTEVLGISVDSVYTLAKYKEEQSYNFHFLSDFNKEVSVLYEAFHATFGKMNMKGVSKRAAFIIDKKGILQYAEILENPGAMPDFDAIDSKLAELA